MMMTYLFNIEKRSKVEIKIGGTEDPNLRIAIDYAIEHSNEIKEDGLIKIPLVKFKSLDHSSLVNESIEISFGETRWEKGPIFTTAQSRDKELWLIAGDYFLRIVKVFGK